MATYASLTPAQQDAVENLVNPLRAFAAQLMHLNVLAARISADWNGGVSTIVGTLDSGETIPNTSALAGAQGLAPADVTNLAGYAINHCDPSRSPTANDGTGGGYNSAFIQALAVKAAGIGATL